jgi:glucose-1-phosphatase
MNNGRIRLVCFDVGGVLVKHCRSWAEGCRAAGLPLHAVCESPDLLPRRRELWRQHGTGRITGPAFFRGVSELLSGVYSPEDVARIHHAWLGTEYDGVYGVVERLVGAGRVETTALSNTNHEHWIRFDPPEESAGGRGTGERRNREFPSVGLLGRRFASHLMGFAKPDPEIYAAFERAVGVPADAILFLDDLPDNIAAARARGWTGDFIDHTTETAGQIEGVLTRHGLL